MPTAMKFGFTGSRHGMTDGQKSLLITTLRSYRVDEFHHGDCVGADEEAHTIVRRYCPQCRIVVHPPDNPRWRAHCTGDVVVPVEDYIARNHAIVNACDILIAAPHEAQEIVRSGTWATVRYARRNKRDIHVLHPSGFTIDVEGTWP